jgi:DNA-binding GntR family transcriptional regulator
VSKPLYRQIAGTLEKKIRSGELDVEDVLPTEQSLQEIYNVSRVTVRKALELLEKQGLLERIKGSGTYVKCNSAKHDAFHLKGFDENVTAQGRASGTKVIHFQLEQAQPGIAEHLNIEVGTLIYSILRIRTIEDEPEILEQSYMPLSLFPDLSVKVMQTSKYHYIEKQKGYQIFQSRQDLKPVLATNVVAKHLNIETNYPVLRLRSISELVNGEIFEYSIQYLRGYQYRFEYTARRGLE